MTHTQKFALEANRVQENKLEIKKKSALVMLDDLTRSNSLNNMLKC